jgi:hypothetical protein
MELPLFGCARTIFGSGAFSGQECAISRRRPQSVVRFEFGIEGLRSLNQGQVTSSPRTLPITTH